MVADDNAWLIEVGFLFHVITELRTWYTVMYHDKTRSMIDKLMQTITFLLRYFSHFNVKPNSRCKYTHCEEQEE